MPLVWCLASMLLALSVASPAFAQNRDAEARRLFNEGDHLYQEGRYEEAITRFEESYALSGRALLLFNMANAYERLGRYASAADALRRYLPSAPASETRIVENRITMLERRAAEQAAPPPVDPPPTPVLPIEEEPAMSGTELAGWIMVASGGAFVVGGVIAALLTLGPRSDLDALCVDGTCPRAAEDAASENTTLSLVADLGMFGGAAIAAAGVVLVIVAGSEGEVPVTASLSPNGGLVTARIELP
jgi:hypothetical protein